MELSAFNRGKAATVTTPTAVRAIDARRDSEAVQKVLTTAGVDVSVNTAKPAALVR
jgi:hypothetical protein